MRRWWSSHWLRLAHRRDKRSRSRAGLPLRRFGSAYGPNGGAVDGGIVWPGGGVARTYGPRGGGGLRGGDPAEELLECMAHLSDQVGRKPSGAMYTGWYQ